MWLALLMALAPTALLAYQYPLAVSEFMAINAECCADPFGEFDDWVELHNHGDEALDIGGVFLTDDLSRPQRWQIPADVPSLTTLKPQGYLILWLDGEPDQGPLHAGLRLDADGEQLGLYAPDGLTLIDSLTFDSQRADVSMGRSRSGEWRFFQTATPGRRNVYSGRPGFAAAPVFSEPAGLYPAGLTVSLAAGSPAASVYHVSGGALPRPVAEELYDGAPLAIDATTVIRARAYEEGLWPSAVTTATFVVGEDFDLPVLSVVTDPPNLWDEDTGIYVLGPNVSPEAPWPLYGANFHQPWEKPAHVEYLEPGGGAGFVRSL